MRIGVSLLSHDETWGGPGVSTKEIVRHLLAMDRRNEYILMYPGFGAARRHRGQYSGYANVTEVEAAHWRLPVSEAWEQIAVPRLAKRYGIDLFFGPCMAVPIAGRYKKAMIVHGVEYYTVPEAFDLNTALRWRFMERFVLPAADRVVSVSDTMTRTFHQVTGYPLDRLRTIQLGVADRFAPVTSPERLAAVRRTYHLDEPFLLFVGRIFPSKNLGTLLHAFATLVDKIPHRLVVVGRPRWKYVADLSLVDRLGLGARVQRLDFVPGEDLAALYSMAECFVYPSLYESFGLAPLEAMACGCPVVAANVGAIPEVSGAAALLVDPRDAGAMSGTIASIIDDPELRRALVERGLAHVKPFTWTRTARQVLDILTETAERDAEPPAPALSGVA